MAGKVGHSDNSVVHSFSAGVVVRGAVAMSVGTIQGVGREGWSTSILSMSTTNPKQPSQRVPCVQPPYCGGSGKGHCVCGSVVV